MAVYEPGLCALDADGDGYGDINAAAPLEAGTDCDDADADVFPGAAAQEPTLCARDADHDGYGDLSATSPVDTGTDCDDSDADVFPGVAAQEPTLCARDADHDGYGDMSATSPVDTGTDCDDSDISAYPGAATSEPNLCTIDQDADGYGDMNAVAPVEAGTDCDDSDATLDPSDADGDGDSSCDGDCDDSNSSLNLIDADSDGVTTCDGDCDDNDNTVNSACSEGEAMLTSGTWIGVSYEVCGTGSSCTASQAKAACSAVGSKVLSHASNGTSSVKSLGASSSCNWSVSYFTVDAAMSSGDCLVGISNLEWSSCCGTSSWHGNTMKFGSASTVFGYVASSNSGYKSSYSNSSGTTWGCTPESSGASTGSCSTLYVACED
jgi:hypothetical protein